MRVGVKLPENCFVMHRIPPELFRWQVLEDLGNKNRAAAMTWNEMSQEVKQRYQQMAAQLPSPSDNNYDNWQETQQILSNMQVMLFSYTVVLYVVQYITHSLCFTTAFYNQIGQMQCTARH